MIIKQGTLIPRPFLLPGVRIPARWLVMEVAGRSESPCSTASASIPKESIEGTLVLVGSLPVRSTLRQTAPLQRLTLMASTLPAPL